MAAKEKEVKVTITAQCLVHGEVKKVGSIITVGENDAKILKGSAKAADEGTDAAKAAIASVKKASGKAA